LVSSTHVVAGHDLGFTEGPVVLSSGCIAVVSASAGQVLRQDRSGGPFEVAATTGGGPNGLAEGADGTLFVAQCGAHVARAGYWPPSLDPRTPGGIQQIGSDGEPTWVSLHPVSPNDLCFGPDGFLYLTDPTRPGARNDARLWRCDPTTGESELLASVPYYANGIAFGREDDALYVASSNDARILRYPLGGSGLGPPEVFVQLERNLPDGFAFDSAGNVLVAAASLTDAPGEVQVWSPDGAFLDAVSFAPARLTTNVALSADRRLVVTLSDVGQVVTVNDWPEPGLPLHPFRRREEA
jgi:gluconolactonase